MTPSQPTAILLVSCPDQRGIVAALSAFITQHNGNIIALDQYVDTEESAFFARMEWELDGFAFPLEQFAARFEPVARPRRIEWRLHLSDRRLRMAVMVSRQAHCLYDILARWESGEWPIELSLVLSNHDDHRGLVERHGLPFHHIPVEAATKAEAEDRQIALLKQANVDFIVLARYMQILGPSFVQTFPMRILNIHHSFLPALPAPAPITPPTTAASKSSAPPPTTSPKNSMKGPSSNRTSSAFPTARAWTISYGSDVTSKKSSCPGPSTGTSITASSSTKTAPSSLPDGQGASACARAHRTAPNQPKILCRRARREEKNSLKPVHAKNAKGRQEGLR